MIQTTLQKLMSIQAMSSTSPLTFSMKPMASSLQDPRLKVSSGRLTIAQTIPATLRAQLTV
jgi:hypothetical protein